MLDYNIVNRFNAANILSHPWITRQQTSAIPWTNYDMIFRLDCEDHLRALQKGILFMTVIKRLRGKKSNMEEYKKCKPYNIRDQNFC